MSELEFPSEPRFVETRLRLAYRYGAGRFASRYLVKLRDQAVFEGVRCPQCRRVYVPPRPVCGICYVACEEWVPIGPEGSITGATVVETPFVDPITGRQRPVPYGFAIIRLDGASTNIYHFLDETDRDRIQVGMRVRPRFRAQREGSVTDVECFEIIRD